MSPDVATSLPPAQNYETALELTNHRSYKIGLADGAYPLSISLTPLY